MQKPMWPAVEGAVVFPDGRSVRGTGLRSRPVGGPDPQFGVYLLGRAPSPVPWPYQWIRWPDFRTPSDSVAAVTILREAHARSASERVEIGCGGGIGRTGTAMAVLAVLSGVPAAEAVAWVRNHYHRRAVETPFQRRWVQRVAAEIKEMSAPRCPS
ncbi:MAG: hypothetical protein KDB26_11570 [Microthrixaceae bacterium]|nr:hypothetical protein [Microthrixaceae bacterium]